MANWLTAGVDALSNQFAGLDQLAKFLPNKDAVRQDTPGFTSNVDPTARFQTNYDALRPSADQYTGDAMDSYLQQKLAPYQQAQQPGQNVPTGNYGGVSNAGGNWALLDQSNKEISAAAAKYHLPANLLKSMINNESSGEWGRDGSRVVNVDGTQLLPFVGVKREAAQSVGFNFDQMVGNRQMQVDAMAAILARDYRTYGSWEAAASNYLTGDPNAYKTGGTDSQGLRADYYVNKALTNWKYLDSIGGPSMDPANPGYGSYPNNASAVVNAATSYVNQAPYIWGAIPGASQDPRVTGWDCSGMTYWLDQKYGTGSLPMGSHYQYQWAQQSGNLFMDVNQLKPGDLIFWDTGNYAGGGHELNNAGHVGMYIGNGKVVQAANQQLGTIISDLSGMNSMYRFLGAAHMSWSGGGAYAGPASGGSVTSPSQTGGYTGGYDPVSIINALRHGQRPPGY